MKNYQKFCLAYLNVQNTSTKLFRNYQLSLWEDFISIDECKKLYDLYKFKNTNNKIYNIALLDNNDKITFLYDI